MATSFRIVSGPSKFDLMAALFSRSGAWTHGTQLVEFTYQDGDGNPKKIKTSVTQVGAEDGSGESWMLEGNVNDEHLTVYKAHFRTDNRHGCIEFAT